jgi:hypothetical protein
MPGSSRVELQTGECDRTDRRLDGRSAQGVGFHCTTYSEMFGLRDGSVYQRILPMLDHHGRS